MEAACECRVPAESRMTDCSRRGRFLTFPLMQSETSERRTRTRLTVGGAALFAAGDRALRRERCSPCRRRPGSLSGALLPLSWETGLSVGSVAPLVPGDRALCLEHCSLRRGDRAHRRERCSPRHGDRAHRRERCSPRRGRPGSLSGALLPSPRGPGSPSGALFPSSRETGLSVGSAAPLAAGDRARPSGALIPSSRETRLTDGSAALGISVGSDEAEKRTPVRGKIGIYTKE
ncbi:hypothetical protein NDU88_007646 [Pleurodeles waltl]|uniref:Uncharacterized protein n=1 Tax=Pleurodeles waltl TaxID=8319 RepID=A0AAV7VV08_PLEWA|nr:hypothetical protein NDU88_007646 [Pleurodeles waltl]